MKSFRTGILIQECQTNGRMRTMHWLYFIGGVFAGAALGVFVMCLCAAAGDEDRRRRRSQRETD